MDTGRPPDLVPAPPAPPAPSRRGGRRPGAGAPKGNLNGLKHGRYSRFKDQLPMPPADPAHIARRVAIQEQRDIERLAASFLRLARFAAYHRERAQAVIDGRPLPEPPLSKPTAADLARLDRYSKDLDIRNGLEVRRRQGRLGRRSEEVQRDLRMADNISFIIPRLAALLDRATSHAALPTPDSLVALLSAAAPAEDNQSPNHPQLVTPESASNPAPTPTEFTTQRNARNKQSNAPQSPYAQLPSNPTQNISRSPPSSRLDAHPPTPYHS